MASSAVVSTAALAVSWSSASYLRMSQPRLRPALDLLQRALVASSEGLANSGADGSRPVPRVLDLGCGPGNITPYLAQVSRVHHNDNDAHTRQTHVL